MKVLNCLEDVVLEYSILKHSRSEEEWNFPSLCFSISECSVLIASERFSEMRHLATKVYTFLWPLHQRLCSWKEERKAGKSCAILWVTKSVGFQGGVLYGELPVALGEGCYQPTLDEAQISFMPPFFLSSVIPVPWLLTPILPCASSYLPVSTVSMWGLPESAHWQVPPGSIGGRLSHVGGSQP